MQPQWGSHVEPEADGVTLADECAARVHDRARQAAARITNQEEAMTAQDAVQGTSGVEALARVLRAVGVEIGYTGADAYRKVVAERILADPGPLLEALAEAGVLREERAALRPCGCRRPEGDISGCCLRTDVLGAAPERRYVTEWRPADA